MNNILVKGDISGIQEFIFNVTSEKAAVSIKAKEFFIKAISLISVEYLFEKFGINEEDKDEYKISVSGGNFFILLPDLENKESLLLDYKTNVNRSLQKIGLKVVLSHTNVTADYALMLDTLTSAGRNEKYRPLNGINYSEAFSPFPNTIPFPWNDFGDFLKKTKSFTLRNGLPNDLIKITQNKISLLSYELKLDEDEASDPNFSLKNKLDTYFPCYDKNLGHGKNIGDPKLFEDIAGKTGKSNKLGILKLDVDDMGDIFRKVKTKEEHKMLSKVFSHFIETEVYNLIQSNRYKNTIYALLAGGDDCFFIGAWDKIIDFAKDLNKKFTAYWKDNKDINPKFSAGIIIVHQKFPVIRFAELVENALHNAKLASGKDSVSIFNVVIKWQDWKEIDDVESKLDDFIKGGKKALLMNARKAVIGRDNSEKLELVDFWELAYYLRTVNKKVDSEKVIEILSLLENHLEKSIGDIRYRYFFPIAARIVELKNKK